MGKPVITAILCLFLMPGASAQDNDRRRTHELNDPAGQFEVEPLANDTQVKLTGRIKTLKLASVDGAAVLDASELQASEIIVSGEINGGAKVRLNAPGGKVQLIGDVNGGAAVEINAPDGVVILGSEQGGLVGGGTRLTITARDVQVLSTGSGGTHINLIFSDNASMKFTRLEGGAHINWRQTHPDSAKPKIDAGAVVDGAACGQEGHEAQFKPVFDQQNNPPRNDPPVLPITVPKPVVEVGPLIPAGLIATNGKHMAGEILAVDDQTVEIRLADGKSDKVPLSRVAIILFRPTPESARSTLERGSAGLLLRGGDFVDGSVKTIQGSSVTMSSVLFGIKRFEVGRDAVALVIRRPSSSKQNEK